MKHLQFGRYALVLASTLLVGIGVADIEVVPLPIEAPDIPHGHLPQPGECRIWMPEQPPGQQSTPGACADLADEVPLGGWLIYRATPDAVGISAYSVDVDDLVGDIRFYDVRTLEPLAGPPTEVPAVELELPRGHLPSPGECRIWFPGRSPGQQPDSSRCGRALKDVPSGAWVLYRLSPQEVVVTAYHPELEGVVLESRTFDVDR